jgi:hypothetical protein
VGASPLILVLSRHQRHDRVNKVRTLGAIEHIVGAACAVALFYWSAEIATVVSEMLARMLEGLKGGSRIYFVGGVFGLHALGALCGLAILGLIVAGFDRLVAAGRLRRWAPPFAVFAVATAVMIPLFRSGGADAEQAAVVGTTFAAIVSFGFTTWWVGALLAALMRRRTIPEGAGTEESG